MTLKIMAPPIANEKDREREGGREKLLAVFHRYALSDTSLFLLPYIDIRF